MDATRKQWLIRGLVVIVALAIIVRQYVKYKIAPELSLQQVELVSLQGDAVDLATNYQGKHLLLTTFATWCGPCHAEVPEMEKVRPQLEAAGFVLIHVSDEDVNKINGFMLQNPSGITYLQSIRPLADIGAHTYPTHFVFDKTGTLRFKQTDPLDWQNPETVQELIDLVN